jgi:hypothetical protein
VSVCRLIPSPNIRLLAHWHLTLMRKPQNSQRVISSKLFRW